jgi:Fe-S-cluster containining protein
MPDPWYADGLNFTCTRCGNCCTGEPGFVWVTDDEIAALAALRGEPVDEFTGLHTKAAHRGRTLREKGNGDCVFYDKATGCTVYEARPRQCRTWPFWESTVATPAAWEHTKGVCPGAGRGNLIPAEEITRRLKVIKL